jgi:hypothetical protein
MTKILWTTLVSLLLISSPTATQPSPVRIFIPNQSRDNPAVFSALSTLIKASERFVWVDDYDDANVFVNVKCIEPAISTDSSTCFMTADYVLPHCRLTRLLTEEFVTGKNEDVATSFYRNLERRTAQSHLSSAEKEVRAFVRSYCDDPSHSDDCRDSSSAK